MDESDLSTKIVDRDIIGDDVPVEPRRELLLEARLRVDHEPVTFGANEDIRAEFSLRGGDAGGTDFAGRHPQNVDRHLPVEISHAIRPGEPQLHPIAEVSNSTLFQELLEPLRGAAHGEV